MRDDFDIPVLASAILEDVDLLISGDKDFSSVDVEKPEILTPSEFLNIYSTGKSQ
jgi:predicted nucleic acid-binding protein